MNKAMVVYSGGMDSFTTLHCALNRHGTDNVQAFSLNYGQRHIKELAAAKSVCATLGIRHHVLHAPELANLLGGSALTAGEIPVPEGHYADESMRATVVPNRNMILLSIAMGVAIREGMHEVYCGVHAGDHAIYPDCRPAFFYAMDEVALICDYKPLRLITPFIRDTKADILEIGLREGLDYSQTWTCYNGRALSCGKCGACVERLEAFNENEEIDPLQYEAAQ